MYSHCLTWLAEKKIHIEKITNNRSNIHIQSQTNTSADPHHNVHMYPNKFLFYQKNHSLQ